MKLTKQIQAINLVQDKEQLDKFIDWLPEVPVNHVYLIQLVARKKYSNDKNHVHSTIKLQTHLAYKKHDIINKIRKMEIEQGLYTIPETDKSISPESLVVYLELNPSNITTAIRNHVYDLFDKLVDQKNNIKPEKNYMSNLAKASKYKNFIDVDLDDISESKYQEVLDEITNNYLDSKCITTIQTRSGYHILIKTEFLNVGKNILDKKWYTKIKQMNVVDDMSSTSYIPIPGVLQGGFIPKFVS